MEKLTDVLFLIVARSGSKGVPNKNIKNLNTLPLLAYRIKSANAISNVEHIWLSTDSQDYCDIALQYHVTIPFLRPISLSDDHSSSIDVVLHAMNHAKILGLKYNFIALLEPTSPFVYAHDLYKAIQQLRNSEEAKAIIATKIVETKSMFIQPESKYLDFLALKLESLKSTRRQDITSEITPSGGFYISKWNDFLKENTFYTEKSLSYILPEESSLEIDNPLQFAFADFLIEKQIIEPHKIFNYNDE